MPGTRRPSASRLLHAIGLAAILGTAAPAASATAGADVPETARAAPAAADPSAPSLVSYREALELVESALVALGGPGAIERAGGLTLVGRGSWDLSTRLQGRFHDRAEPVPLEEALVLDPAGERLVFESHGRANADAEEHLRFVYEGAERVLLVDRMNDRAFWIGGGQSRAERLDDRRRYERLVPHRLLEDALDHRRTLRSLGTVGAGDARRRAVAYTLPTGESLTLLFATGEPRLLGAEYLLDMPLLGDATVRFDYLPWRPVEGLGSYPSGYRSSLGGRSLREVVYETVAAGTAAAGAYLAPPPGIEVPPPPAPEPADAAEAPAASPEPPLPEPRELAPGVWLVPNIRGGFHPLLVELADGLLVVEAPTGWYELQQLPAKNWSAGETSSSVSRRLLEVARRTVPGKPVRWLVLTHHHSDHAGGVRPFLAAGATVLAPPAAAEMVRRAAAAPFTLEPDELSERFTNGSAVGRVEEVEGRRVIGGGAAGAREVHLLDVGDNPHARGMLVVWLPAERILYQSDLFEPIPPRVFPSRERLPVMRWFVGWLDRSGLEPDRIYAIHGTGEVTEEQLEVVRAGGG